MKTNSTSTESNQDTSIETNDLGVEPVTAADLGYDDEPATPPAKAPEAAKPAAPAEPAKEEKVEPVSGYAKPASAKPAEPATPPAAEPAKPDDKPAEPTDEEKALKEIETAVSTLGDTYNKSKITEFAVKHKFSKEQVEAYIAQIKADDAAEVKAREERVTKQREEWNNDLYADKDFGGENFDKSVHEVESLLQKMFPNTKKVLTDKKGMLPPYFMKDLLAVAKALKPTNKFEGGEPPAPADETTSFLDDMYS